MKKWLCALLAGFLALYLSGCAAVYTTSPVDPGLRRLHAYQAL